MTEMTESIKQETAVASGRTHGLKKNAEDTSCGGCLGPEVVLFHTCRKCEARRCCGMKGLRSCAECTVASCALLEKAQARWDEVPTLVQAVSPTDFANYVKGYCDPSQKIRTRAASTREKELCHDIGAELVVWSLAPALTQLMMTSFGCR